MMQWVAAAEQWVAAAHIAVDEASPSGGYSQTPSSDTYNGQINDVTHINGSDCCVIGRTLIWHFAIAGRGRRTQHRL